MGQSKYGLHQVTFQVEISITYRKSSKTITACLKIINIDEDQLCNLPLGVHFTRANYYRILALDMIDAQKVLYLDVDLIITQNITSLWEQQLNNVILAAVDEQNSERVTALNLKRGASYFNSGVMLVNLELWRSSQISKKSSPIYSQFSRY